MRDFGGGGEVSGFWVYLVGSLFERMVDLSADIKTVFFHTGSRTE